ncbi:hypothetical protein Tco_0345380 [Tanacetum coccineum]
MSSSITAVPTLPSTPTLSQEEFWGAMRWYQSGPKEPQTPPVPQDEDEHDETEDGLVDYPMDGGKDEMMMTAIHSGMTPMMMIRNEEDEMRRRRGALRPGRHCCCDLLLSLELLSGFRLHIPFTEHEGERLARCTALFAHSSQPLVPSSLLPSFGCPTQIQTLKIASTQALLIVAPGMRSGEFYYLLYPPDCQGEIIVLGRGVDYGFLNTLDVEERRRGIREVGYGIRDT